MTGRMSILCAVRDERTLRRLRMIRPEAQFAILRYVPGMMQSPIKVETDVKNVTKRKRA